MVKEDVGSKDIGNLDVIDLWQQAQLISRISEKPTYQVFDALLIKADKEKYEEPYWWRIRARKCELIEKSDLFHCDGFLPISEEDRSAVVTEWDHIGLLRMCPICGWRRSQWLIENIKLSRPMARRATGHYGSAERDKYLARHAAKEVFCWLIGQLALDDESSWIHKYPYELDFLRESLEQLYPDNEIPDEYLHGGA